MSIVVNGSGTITGISTGGLPDGSVDVDTLAANSVTAAKIVDGTIVDAEVTSLAASKLTGALPAISGASLTNLPATDISGKLNLSGGTMTGQLNIIQSTSGTGSSAVKQLIYNEGAGDAALHLALSGSIDWYMGADNTDNALKLGQASWDSSPYLSITTAGAVNIPGDLTCESVQGGDYTTSAGTISISCGSWGNMIQLSALDAGYLYYGDAYLPGYEHGTYHASFLIQSNTVNADVTYITRGAYQEVRVNGGWIQTKEGGSGGSPSHYMKVRKLAKDT